jgi:phage recombination protein Bet
MNVALRPVLPVQVWHQDAKKISLVKKMAAKDCSDDEFNVFVAVAADLNLNPLRKQIYAFVFNKNDAERRNMTLVVGIDGGRAIAARTGNYRPDDQEPQWVFRDDLKDPLTNPHGIEKCTVGVYHRPTRGDPFERIVHTVYWEEFAPLVTRGESDAYEWVDTGEVWPDSGKPKMKKRLREGSTATLRLDPNKEQWIRAGRNQIAKCAEMGALRKGWPEDLSRIVVEEETHRAAVIDAEYVDLTPAELAAKGEQDARMEKIGGPAIFAAFDAAGTLERVEIGKFFDRVNAHTRQLKPGEVASFVMRNREALREFWGRAKTDALELKKILERRSGTATSTPHPSERDGVQEKAAPSRSTEADLGPDNGAANSKSAPSALAGEAAEKLRAALLIDLAQLRTRNDFETWARDAKPHLERLPPQMRSEVENELERRRGDAERPSSAH